MISYGDIQALDARLEILKALAEQADGRAAESFLVNVLDRAALKKSRDWLRTQLRAMDELGAIRLSQHTDVFIAAITRLGLDHVERRIIIEGVTRPAPEV